MVQNKQNKHCRTLALFQSLMCHFRSLKVHETTFDGHTMQPPDNLPSHLDKLNFRACLYLAYVIGKGLFLGENETTDKIQTGNRY